MKWLLVGMVAGSTIAADLLQAFEMKRQGEVSDLRLLGIIFRKRLLILAVGFMAVSFFSLLKLLTVADLSFAVPATAATFIFETILAKIVLKETVQAKRWIGVTLVAGGVLLLAL